MTNIHQSGGSSLVWMHLTLHLLLLNLCVRCLVNILGYKTLACSCVQLLESNLQAVSLLLYHSIFDGIVLNTSTLSTRFKSQIMTQKNCAFVTSSSCYLSPESAGYGADNCQFHQSCHVKSGNHPYSNCMFSAKHTTYNKCRHIPPQTMTVFTES